MVPKSSLRVLVVDDDTTTLLTVSALLEDEGHKVSTRNEMLGTLPTVLKERPDVVLLDIGMPALSGDQLAKLISADVRLGNVSLVLHSSMPAERLAAVAKECGAIGYIVKSASNAEFLRGFHEMASRHAARVQRK